jgi:hypothetical protein
MTPSGSPIFKNPKMGERNPGSHFQSPENGGEWRAKIWKTMMSSLSAAVF